MNRVDVLGVPVACLGKDQLIGQVTEWAGQEAERPRWVTYVNANCLNVAAADLEYHRLLNRADLVYSDGIGAVWAGRMLGHGGLEKVTGRDWIEDFCAGAARCGLSLYILAGAPGVAQKAVVNLKQRWPTLVVAAVRDGYFLEKSELDVIAEIAALRPDVLLLGMGVPAQEKWAGKHQSSLAVRVCWMVGALFDYVAGIEPPVPARMNAMGLEWLWRFYCDPRGKWRRYLIGIPRFVARVLWRKIMAL